MHLAPRLPEGLHRIEVDGLVIGGATVSVQADRDGGRIVGLPPHLRVV